MVTRKVGGVDQSLWDSTEGVACTTGSLESDHLETSLKKSPRWGKDNSRICIGVMSKCLCQVTRWKENWENKQICGYTEG